MMHFGNGDKLNKPPPKPIHCLL